jgi:hypothetical protein
VTVRSYPLVELDVRVPVWDRVHAVAPLAKVSILCASDPYAVLGVQEAFGLTPDLVAGPAADTTAAAELVQKLTGVRALNLLGRGGADEPRTPLDQRIVRPAVLR